jgi:hypothetical protein
MSEHRPNPTSSQDIVNRLADLADSERRERRVRVPRRERPSREKATRLALGIAVPLFVVVAAFNFGGPLLARMFETPLPVSAARVEAQKTLSELVEEIESFRENYDELPESLVEIGVPAGQWTYILVGTDEYRIHGVVGGQEVTFESSTKRGAR